jgi:hypothetical protein
MNDDLLDKATQEEQDKMSFIVKCKSCGHVLISGVGSYCMFSKGTSIACMKCGNKYTF